jgi:hypothetical protein
MEVLRFAVLKPVHLPSPAVLNLARIRSWVAAGEECEDGGGGRTGGARESREDVLAALQSGGERRECDVSKTTLQNRLNSVEGLSVRFYKIVGVMYPVLT